MTVGTYIVGAWRLWTGGASLPTWSNLLWL